MSVNSAIQGLIKALETNLYAKPCYTEADMVPYYKRMKFQEMTLKLLGWTMDPSWGTSYWHKTYPDGTKQSLNLYHGVAIGIGSLDDVLKNVTFDDKNLKLYKP